MNEMSQPTPPPQGGMPQSIDANLPVSLTLIAAEWDVVLSALDNAPIAKRFTGPLDAKIRAAVIDQAEG